MNNKILFCGSSVPNEIEYQIKDISAAGNRFQNNFVDNLTDLGNAVEVLSFIGVPILDNIKSELLNPVTTEIMRATKTSGLGSDFIDQSIKRTYLFKQDSTYGAIKNYHKQLKKKLGNCNTVICYNVIYAWLTLPFMAKKAKVKSILILADYSGPECFSNIARKIYAYLQLYTMRRFDVVVGLSDNIESKLTRRQRFVLMEGGIDQSLLDYFGEDSQNELIPIVVTKKSETILMYSGLLSEVTGVNLLLEAMALIKNPDIRLVITGKGDLEYMVRSACKLDKRIIFKGHLQYNEYLKCMKEADILINPRNMDMPENQNNFPSKIIDYLAAGKVILSTRFAGWKKYRDNIFFCDSTGEIIARNIEYLLKINDKVSGNVYEVNRKTASGFEWKTQIKELLEG